MSHTLRIILVIALCPVAGGCNDGDALPNGVPSVELEPGGCPTFDSTFAAIQKTVFERRGCTADACHGKATQGGLDLRADAAYQSLVNAASEGSSLLRVDPTRVTDSYLFQKLAARTDESLVTKPIAGQPMPVTGDALTADQLEAIRLWIETGAPETGSIGDEFGGNRLGSVLGACLPDPAPVAIRPLPPPSRDAGVQMAMPPYRIPAGTEAEICFAEYVDFRDSIPARFLTPDGNFFYANGSEERADPNSHHRTISYSGLGADMVSAPEFGRWECASGPREGEECDPVDRQACAGAKCRSESQNKVACLGFGPPGGGNGSRPETRLATSNGRPGFFAKYPAHGIFYWNSHAFNLTPEDLVHHEYENIYFTDDLRFEDAGLQDVSHLSIAAGTAPFTKKEYCADYVLPQGTQLLSLTSHTHKRGERFTMHIQSTGEHLYDNPFWDDPVVVKYDPPRLFDTPDAADRTITYCALYNNGVAINGAPDLGKVTRLSQKPERSTCTPVACATGRLGEPCAGKDDNATCDTSPGAGDGMCDACAITGGITSDDEMFVFSGSYLKDASTTALPPVDPTVR
jgi:hypothetical protein